MLKGKGAKAGCSLTILLTHMHFEIVQILPGGTVCEYQLNQTLSCMLPSIKSM